MIARLLASAILTVVAAGCQRADADTVVELRALREELRSQRTTDGGGASPNGELRQAMQPLQQAFDTVLTQHEAERSRWSALSTEVGKLATMVGDRVDDADKASLAQVQQRLAELEQNMRDERATHARERELILKALEHTADKLDVFLQRVKRIEPAPAPDAGAEEKPKGEATPPGTAGKEQADARGMDLTLVVLAAALVLVLVAIVILFPGPLGRAQRTPVVQLRARADADDDLTPDLLAAMEAVVLEPDGGFGAGDEGPSPVVELDDDPTQPWRVEQELPCARPDVIGPMLHERLTQDSRVLVEPAPTVRAGADSVTLRYHLAPHLTRGEADRLRSEVESLAINGSRGGGGPRNGTPAP